MRAIWKGVVSFGLVTIPIKLFSATEQHDVQLRQVHAADGGRIRYRRVCEAEDVEVPYSEIAKGYELPDGQVVVLDDEDFEKLPIASGRNIDVQKFVPSEQVDGLYLSKGYFLQADGPGAKPYVLLREALERAGTVALVKVALRQREALALLRPYGEVLLLQTMLWPDEIRDPAELAPDSDITVRAQEMQMAESYIQTLTGDLDMDEFSDDYAVALREVVDAKIQGHEVTQPEAPAEGGGAVLDLMAALEASVAEAKRARGEAVGETRPAAKSTPAKKSAPRKAAPKKATASSSSSAAKKTTAKKTSTKTAAKKAPAKTAARTTTKGTSQRKTA
ncbi:Ku protein [Cryptosporangium aurantiacum]|uniref:Non-homologous end joining protein Ku n=1 Tax=Cryptosporangium aurantiacum TaxID=134849 RepID=A0A1M7JEI2_9ACTN|nr:Ku protein [Cryptosporangium aurantiacum]SHM51378.1 DNA end-binding protein Ku [Cryptosporangium aurantiacum]